MIVGLPASGKTTFAKKFLENNPEFTLIDDPTVADVGLIYSLLLEGKDIIVCDPHLCKESNREKVQLLFTVAGYEVFWTFFENNIDKCLKNVTLRNDGRVIGDLRSYKYTIPEDATVLQIYEQVSN